MGNPSRFSVKSQSSEPSEPYLPRSSVFISEANTRNTTILAKINVWSNIAMVKQLGIPTWFMTLSCADLRWPELFQILARIQGNDLTNEKVDALSYNDRCQMHILNPVVVA